GMEVDADAASNRSLYQGQTYYFCSPSCHSRFNAHPEKFVRGATQEDGAAGPPLPASKSTRLRQGYPPSLRASDVAGGAAGPPSLNKTKEGGTYTCPMHPDV